MIETTQNNHEWEFISGNTWEGGIYLRRWEFYCHTCKINFVTRFSGNGNKEDFIKHSRCEFNQHKV